MSFHTLFVLTNSGYLSQYVVKEAVFSAYFNAKKDLCEADFWIHKPCLVPLSGQKSWSLGYNLGISDTRD